MKLSILAIAALLLTSNIGVAAPKPNHNGNGNHTPVVIKPFPTIQPTIVQQPRVIHPPVYHHVPHHHTNVFIHNGYPKLYYPSTMTTHDWHRHYHVYFGQYLPSWFFGTSWIAVR